MSHQISVKRAAVLDRIAALIPRADALDRHVFVAIDGVDGSGKTTFADELKTVFTRLQPAIRISIDDFHLRKRDRYRQGRASPEGFYRDSYDYRSFHRYVVAPLSSGDGPYLAASHDLDTDELLEGPLRRLSRPSVVIVDGIFLHRPELRGIWDFSVFLRVDFSVSAARMAARDGSDPDPGAASNERYVGGQRIYLAEESPELRASVVVDNNVILEPRIVRGPHPVGDAARHNGPPHRR